MKEPPDYCANCGAAIPRHAHACPECGADERTGWAENSLYDGLDLPPDEETEAQEVKIRKIRSRRERFWWFVAFVTAVAFLLLLLGLH